MFAPRAKETAPARPGRSQERRRATGRGESGRDALRVQAGPQWDFADIAIRPEGHAARTGWTIGDPDTPQERDAERAAAGVSQSRESGRRTAGAASASGRGGAVPESVGTTLDSQGAPLASETRERMEGRFGSDFSQVRVHTDGTAARSAKEIRARAYTAGKDVVFAAGEFAPKTPAGEALLAHELTHVVQQGGQAGLIQRQAAPSNFPDRPQQAQTPPRMSDDDWLSLLNSVRESSSGEFVKFLIANEATFYPILARYGFKGSWTTNDAYLKDFDAAIQKWGGAGRGRFRPSARDRAQVQERQRPRTREDRQYETAKLLIPDYNRHGHTRGDINRDLEAYGLMDELEKNYGFEKVGRWSFTDSEVYEQRAIDAMYKFVLHYEAEHNMTQPSSAGPPSEAVVQQQQQAEFLKYWLEGLQYVTSSVVAAMSAGAMSTFTDDPKKITGAAGAGAAFEGAVGAAAPAVAGRGSYKPDVVGPRDRPEAVGAWRYTGKQPMKEVGDPSKVGAPPVRDPIPPPVQSVQGGGQTTPPKQGHLSVVDPGNTLRPVPPKKPTPPPPGPGNGPPPAGAGAKAANENVQQQTPVYRQQKVVSGGGDASTGTPTKMAVKPREPKPEFERGRRPPSAKEVLGGPSTLSEHVEELGESAQSGEKAKKKGVSTEQKQIRSAGTSMEGGDVQQWGRTFPTSVSVYTNQELPPEIRSLYPKTSGAAQGGPDAIAIDPKKREIIVFDATTKPTPDHTQKTHRDAEILKKNLPERFRGYTVFSQEGWSDGGLRFSERKRH